MKPPKVTGTGRNGRTLKKPSKYCTTSTDEGEILRKASRRENESIKGCIKRMMGDADLEISNMQSNSKNGKSASANKRAQLIHTSASTSTKTTPNLESSQSLKSKSLHFPKSDLTHPKIRTIESIPEDFHLDQRRLSQQYPSKSYSHYDAEINKSDMRHKNKTSSQPILDRSSHNRVENSLKSFNSLIPLNSSSRNNSPEVVSNRSEERAAISPVLCVGSEIGSSQQQSYNVASPRHAQLSTNDHFRFDNRMELADIDNRMGSHNKENYEVNKTISNTWKQYDSSLSKHLQNLEQSLKQHSDTTVKNLTEYVLQNYRQDLQTVYDRWLEQFNKLECTLRRINPRHNVEGQYQKPDGFPLQTVRDFKRFEVADVTRHQAFEAYLAFRGGLNVKDALNQFFKEMITDDLVNHFTWEGTKEKRKLKATHFAMLMHAALLACHNLPNLNRAEFGSEMQHVLHVAKQRVRDRDRARRCRRVRRWVDSDESPEDDESNENERNGNQVHRGTGQRCRNDSMDDEVVQDDRDSGQDQDEVMDGSLDGRLGDEETHGEQDEDNGEL